MMDSPLHAMDWMTDRWLFVLMSWLATDGVFWICNAFYALAARVPALVIYRTCKSVEPTLARDATSDFGVGTLVVIPVLRLAYPCFFTSSQTVLGSFRALAFGTQYIALYAGQMALSQVCCASMQNISAYDRSSFIVIFRPCFH